MTDESPLMPDDDLLRRQAEAELRAREVPDAQDAWDDDHARIVHELRVHQIELELQNDELRRARAELEAALARSTELYEFAPTGYLTLDHDGVIRQLNLTGAQLIGLERSRLVGRRLDVFVDPADRHFVQDLLADVLATGTGGRCEVTLLREGRAPIVVQIEGSRSADGEECRAIVVDTTERRRGEEAVRASEEKHRTLFESSHDAILTLAPPSWKFTSGNPAAIEMFGAHDEAGLLSRGREAYSPELQPDGSRSDERADEMIATAMQEGSHSFTWTHQRLDGELFPATVMLTRAAFGGQGLLQATVRDVTEETRAREEREQLEAQLRMSQKMEAIGHLAGGLSHDFNNLLTVIAGYADLALARMREGSREAYWLGKIAEAVARGSSLTQRLLAFSRKQALAPVVLDLGEVASGMTSLLETLVGEEIAVHMEFDPELARVSADSGQVEQALMNLCGNARDAMPGGGTITIRVTNFVIADADANSHPDVDQSRCVCLSVTDAGVGMSDDVRSQIFEPFFTTKPQGKGTGLGLSMVYGFVKQSGGYVVCESIPGQGSTFRIVLPAVDSVTAEPLQARPRTAATRGAETVLVAEDEPAVGAVVRCALEAAGYTVLAVEDGDAAITLCDTHAGPIHLLLTDVMMPGVTGRQLAEVVQQRRPQTAVLYMSGHTAGLLSEDGVIPPETAFLAKPFTPVKLCAKVRDVLDAAPATGPAAGPAALRPPGGETAAR